MSATDKRGNTSRPATPTPAPNPVSGSAPVAPPNVVKPSKTYTFNGVTFTLESDGKHIKLPDGQRIAVTGVNEKKKTVDLGYNNYLSFDGGKVSNVQIVEHPGKLPTGPADAGTPGGPNTQQRQVIYAAKASAASATPKPSKAPAAAPVMNPPFGSKGVIQGGTPDSAPGVSGEDWALVQKVATKYNIDPYVLVSIGMHETGWGKLGAGRSGFALGVGVPDSGGKISKYQGLSAQLEGAAKILNKNGVSSIQDIQAGKLAPVNGRVKYASDPNWSAAVVAQYDKIQGTSFTATTSTATGKAAAPGAAGAAGGVAGTAGPKAVAAQSAASLGEYSYISALATSEPELKRLMDKYLNEDLTDSSVRQRLAADIQNSHWWRSGTTATRQAELQRAQNPADYRAAIEQAKTPVKDLFDSYLVPTSDQTIATWATHIARGEVTSQDVQNYVKEQAKSLFPGMNAAIDSGVTPATYVQPYADLAAQTLEQPKESINFLDPKWNKALFQVDPKTGQRTSMSLSDWGKTLRTDPTYQYDSTKQARSQAADMTTQLAQTFGAL